MGELNFSAADKRVLRRTCRHFMAQGKGAAPTPKRRRDVAGSARVTYVAIVDTVTGATWDGSESTDETVTVYPFSGGTIDSDNSIEVNVGLPLEDPITVSADKFKKGWVINGELLGVSCVEWDLPEDWES